MSPCCKSSKQIEHSPLSSVRTSSKTKKLKKIRPKDRNPNKGEYKGWWFLYSVLLRVFCKTPFPFDFKREIEFQASEQCEHYIYGNDPLVGGQSCAFRLSVIGMRTVSNPPVKPLNTDQTTAVHYFDRWSVMLELRHTVFRPSVDRLQTRELVIVSSCNSTTNS